MKFLFSKVYKYLLKYDKYFIGIKISYIPSYKNYLDIYKVYNIFILSKVYSYLSLYFKVILKVFSSKHFKSNKVNCSRSFFLGKKFIL